MKQWIPALFVSSALFAGCGDRAADSPPEPEDARLEAPAEPDAADQVNPPAAGEPQPSVRPAPETSATQPTTGTGTTAPRSPDRSPSTGPATRADGNAARSSTPAAAPRAAVREVMVPAGTALPLELMTELSSETTNLEAPVSARLRQAIIVNGVTALPAGTVLTGEVTDVERSGRVRGRARLAFRFTEARAGDDRESLTTNPLTFEAESSRAEDATKIGAGAIGGAIIGGIAGGGDGAAKGAAIGGAAGTGVVLATRGREVTLAKGTDLAASLAQPLTVRVRDR